MLRTPVLRVYIRKRGRPTDKRRDMNSYGHAWTHVKNRFHRFLHHGYPLRDTNRSASSSIFLRLNYTLYYRLESTLNYGLERGWCIAVQKGSNNVALGYDEGSVLIKLGREEPAMSMDSSGKIVWAKHSEIQQVTINSVLP